MGVLPIGYKFLPTDQELIEWFLAKKQNGLALGEDYQIPEKNLYEAVPWNVVKDDDPWQNQEEDSKKKIIYVFTKLSPTGQSKNRVARTAGSGTWEGKAVGVPIKNMAGTVTIGKRRQFAFKMNKGFEKEIKGKGHWIMTEYSLLNYGNCNNGYVICKITKDFSKETEKRVQDGVAATDASTLNGKRKLSDDDRVIHKRKEIISNESASFSLNQHQFLPMEQGGFGQCSSSKGASLHQSENWRFNQYPGSHAQMFGFQNQMLLSNNFFLDESLGVSMNNHKNGENRLVNVQDSSSSQQPLTGFEYHALNNPASKYLSLLQFDDVQGNLNIREEVVPPLVEEEDDQREGVSGECDAAAAGVQGISGLLDVFDPNEWFSEVMKMFDSSLINPIISSL